MLELLSPLLVASAAALLVGKVLRSFNARERNLLAFSFVVHALAAVAQVLITRDYYGGGDMMVYFHTGAEIAAAVRYRPSQFIPELVALFLHGQSQWPFLVMGAGSTTGTLSAVSGMLQLLLGESLYAVCLTVSIGAYFGNLALYRVFREVFPSRLWPRLLVASMLVPSVVFWSSGLLKEALAMAGLGWIVFGLHRIVQGRWTVGLTFVLVASFWVSLVKPYILFSFTIGGGFYWYWRRSLEVSGGRPVTIRPGYLLLGGAVVVGLITGLSTLFPRYSIEHLGEETARLQTVGARVGGGSYYEVAGSPERSLLRQMAFAPFGLLTSLFRPLVFEVRNATMAVSALETTTFILLFVRSMARRGIGGLWLSLRRSPTLMFGFVFILTFGVAVGLASTNLGTLSRYRVPLVPFFAALLAVWNTNAEARRLPTWHGASNH